MFNNISFQLRRRPVIQVKDQIESEYESCMKISSGGNKIIGSQGIKRKREMIRLGFVHSTIEYVNGYFPVDDYN